MVGGLDPARKGGVEAEQGDHGWWIVLTIWVENRHSGCSDPYSDHVRVHAQNWVRHPRYPHPHCCLSQSCNGLWDQDLAVVCWLADKGSYLSGDGSWLKRCGCGRNTQKKRKGKKGGIFWIGTDM
jgi:hypothetical protein